MPTRNTVRILWLALGGALTALAVAFTTLAALAEINEPGRIVETTSRSHALTSPKVVVRATGPVDLSIVAGRESRLDVRRELLWTRNRPVVTERWDGRTLTVDSRCPGETGATPATPDDTRDTRGTRGTRGTRDPACRTHYVLTLPATTGVEAANGDGTVSATGLRGDLRLAADAGDVIVNGSPRTLRVRVHRGDVIGNDLRSAESDVETGYGDVILGFTAAPAGVRAVVRTAGNIEIRVPDEAGGRGYDVRTDSGDATVEVRLDPSAPRRITALTLTGELRILPS
ncbi:DUF4097 family beta strand repeat-containing protein [Streptosporangium sp. DT93]|uniref:DUF4097 family beta strand repeat-containing protein n=1 Tax=Streptosporangium sp. DT93 TaxID=3393428 RepID=UPI003CF87545